LEIARFSVWGCRGCGKDFPVCVELDAWNGAKDSRVGGM
jgi:hypothetical protein